MLFMIAVAVWVFVSLIVVSVFVVGVGTCVKSNMYVLLLKVGVHR